MARHLDGRTARQEQKLLALRRRLRREFADFMEENLQIVAGDSVCDVRDGSVSQVLDVEAPACYGATDNAYLPKSIHGAVVLVQEASGTWRLTNEHVGTSTPGVAFRASKELDDKLDASLSWGSLLDGCDEGDGWVRCRIPRTFANQSTPEWGSFPNPSTVKLQNGEEREEREGLQATKNHNEEKISQNCKKHNKIQPALVQPPLASRAQMPVEVRPVQQEKMPRSIAAPVQTPLEAWPMQQELAIGDLRGYDSHFAKAPLGNFSDGRDVLSSLPCSMQSYSESAGNTGTIVQSRWTLQPPSVVSDTFTDCESPLTGVGSASASGERPKSDAGTAPGPEGFVPESPFARLSFLSNPQSGLSVLAARAEHADMYDELDESSLLGAPAPSTVSMAGSISSSVGGSPQQPQKSGWGSISTSVGGSPQHPLMSGWDWPGQLRVIEDSSTPSPTESIANTCSLLGSRVGHIVLQPQLVIEVQPTSIELNTGASVAAPLEASRREADLGAPVMLPKCGIDLGAPSMLPRCDVDFGAPTKTFQSFSSHPSSSSTARPKACVSSCGDVDVKSPSNITTPRNEPSSLNTRGAVAFSHSAKGYGQPSSAIGGCSRAGKLCEFDGDSVCSGLTVEVSPPRNGCLGLRAIMAARNWAHGASQLSMPPSLQQLITYPCGASINVPSFSAALSSFISLNVHNCNKIRSQMDSGNHIQSALQVYLTCDSNSKGCLVWVMGEIQDFISRAFSRLGAHKPLEKEILCVLAEFDSHEVGTIDALECLCLFDALVRIALSVETSAAWPALPAHSILDAATAESYQPLLAKDASRHSSNASVSTLLDLHQGSPYGSHSSAPGLLEWSLGAPVNVLASRQLHPLGLPREASTDQAQEVLELPRPVTPQRSCSGRLQAGSLHVKGVHGSCAPTPAMKVWPHRTGTRSPSPSASMP